jgi:hypothetical protein
LLEETAWHVSQIIMCQGLFEGEHLDARALLDLNPINVYAARKKVCAEHAAFFTIAYKVRYNVDLKKIARSNLKGCFLSKFTQSGSNG